MNNDINKKRIFLDMDNVLADFASGMEKAGPELLSRYKPDEVPGIFALMDPMPGAIDAVERLVKKYDVFILSTAPWNNPSAWSDKLEWVKKYFGEVLFKRLIISHRKDLLKGDYLIDDRGKNGTTEFEGEWIEFGSKRFPDWNAVLNYLDV